MVALHFWVLRENGFQLDDLLRDSKSVGVFSWVEMRMDDLTAKFGFHWEEIVPGKACLSSESVEPLRIQFFVWDPNFQPSKLRFQWQDSLSVFYCCRVSFLHSWPFLLPACLLGSHIFFFRFVCKSFTRFTFRFWFLSFDDGDYSDCWGGGCNRFKNHWRKRC